MKITTVKTHKIVKKDTDLFKILNQYVLSMKENSILAITSKIVSICEGRLISIDKINKEKLIKQEADFFIPAEENKYGMTLTIKNGVLLPTAGIDESNANGFYILWPKNPQKTANQIRTYLQKRFNLKKVGVLITDSKTTPLRFGTTGINIAYSGFAPLNNYIGKPDIFGKKMRVTKSNVADGLAAAAVLAMGEGKEQTPIAILEDLPNIKFINQNPTQKELNEFTIKMADDIYASILEKANWRKGGGGKRKI